MRLGSLRIAMKKPTKITPTLINRMARRIAQRFRPERIILFGSHARGGAGPDSDVDLLVVMSAVPSKRAAQVATRVALNDFIVPMDIIVTTSDEVERRRNLPGTIIFPALKEGKVLYVRGQP